MLTALLKMNLKLAYPLLATCTAITFLFVWAFQSRGGKPEVCESRLQEVGLEERGHGVHSLIFDDLTPEELMQVKLYLQNNLGVPLVDPPRAKPSDNCIYSVTLQLPPKAEMLKFLDHQGTRPARQALAVLHFGNQKDPNVTEFVVGPLPKPTYHQDVTVQKYGGKLPYSRRFILRSEFKEIYSFLKNKEYPKAPNFMHKVLDYNGSNLEHSSGLPPGLKSGDRKMWVAHFQNVPGSYLHPVGFEVQVDVSSLDVSQWKVQKVFYNGQYFEDMEDIERQFNKGHVKVAKVKKAPLDGGYSSLKQRVPHQGLGPLHYEPRGPRYTIWNNQVFFMSWSFAFGIDANRGPQAFDIRFKGKRIVYELSLQEASAIYGSNSPASMLTRYMDRSFGLGYTTSTLVKGLDCPYLATYLSRHYLLDSSLPVSRKNSICIFEQNPEMPVRRHYDSKQIPFYGGLADSVLVFRSISTVSNYDYVWDFIFHQNGAVGVRVHATGYLESAFYFGNATEFGNRVEEWTLGTIHTHNIHFKVDMDIGGVKNSLVANDIAFETVKAPWSPENKIHRMKMIRKVLDTENKAAFRLHNYMPRYLYFVANSTNKWDHRHGYQIQMVSFSGDHLPETDPMERAISWGRYKLAVTKRKEKEPFSSSVYNQMNPWAPSVVFADFINNETIVNEDLVAWINVGFLHIPHAEDIPNTATLGNVVGFLLRPHNYFDDDPSMYSPDSVFFSSQQDPTACEVSYLACLPKTAVCLPNFPPFTYEGFQNTTVL
ncbi:membrane primary amine oxidase-like isoform X2 [Rhineura floridana]|uniref:membrane primary amine oxidase-like isoform X2 n=1 Tax=Rhineura floridana TaxID=261503 RepID=UPI002AC83D1E|nr:membrane primary amine oxidase-like isoform X2 [Rhineura floridana]